MIPKFNKKGNLPHGVHIATIDEVIERYRWRNNSARIRRSDALLSFYNFVSSFALDLYINGSYITTKLSPGDVDLALVLSNDFKLQSTEGIRLLGILNQPKSDLHFFHTKVGLILIS